MPVGRLTTTDADIAKTLATMVEHLGRMTDPSYGKKLRDDLLTLPDEVKAQQDAAQTLIGRANSLKAELQKQESDANEKLAQRERNVKMREAAVDQDKELKKEALAIKEANEAKAKELLAEKLRLEGISNGHKEIEKKHAEAKKTLDERANAIAEADKKLEEKRKEIAAYEKEVNETADQMTSLVRSKVRK